MMNIQRSSSPSYSGYDEIQKKVFLTVSNALKSSRLNHQQEEKDDLDWEFSVIYILLY